MKVLTELVLLSVVLGAVSCNGPEAGVYQSPLGFAVQLPEAWLLVSKETLAADPALLEHRALRLHTVADKEGLRESVTSGPRELIFLDSYELSEFSPNIVAIRKDIPLAKTQAVLDEVCDLMATEIGSLFESGFQVHECEFRSVSSVTAVYFSASGNSPDVWSAQYQIPLSDQTALAIALTAAHQDIERAGSDFESVISSLEILRED